MGNNIVYGSSPLIFSRHVYRSVFHCSKSLDSHDELCNLHFTSTKLFYLQMCASCCAVVECNFIYIGLIRNVRLMYKVGVASEFSSTSLTEEGYGKKVTARL